MRASRIVATIKPHSLDVTILLAKRGVGKAKQRTQVSRARCWRQHVASLAQDLRSLLRFSHPPTLHCLFRVHTDGRLPRAKAGEWEPFPLGLKTAVCTLRRVNPRGPKNGPDGRRVLGDLVVKLMSRGIRWLGRRWQPTSLARCCSEQRHSGCSG